METEIIYISSDDESDSQKENRKKTASTNSAEKSNASVIHTKVEIRSNDDEKVEGNNLKRKISQVNEDRSLVHNNITEKKQKLSNSNIDQDLSKVDEDNIAIVDMLRSNKDWEVRIEKPKLVVKERKRISYIAHDIFPLFISLCLQKCHDKDMEKIVDKLKRRYEELDLVYASSEDFALFLNEKREAIINNDKKLYVHIQEVMNEMKNRIKRSQISQNSETYVAVPSTSYAANNFSVNNAVESDYEDDENVEENEAKNLEKNRKMKQILKAMRKCELVIKKLEEAEVDFDDENDSNYIKVERYKERMVELYDKLCEFTGENADAERAYLRPKHISATQIVAVDQAITNFINSKISKQSRLKKSAFTKDLVFPDYRDILECVSRCNENKNLGLDKRKQEQMAKKAFIEVGEYLQRARRNDYWDTFSLYLENTEDPAIKNKELAEKLSKNCSEGEKRLAAVFEKYTKKQEEMKFQHYNDEITTDEENEEGSSIDEKDENKNDFSIHDSSDEDLDSEDNINETIKGDKSLVEKNENNINIVNADQRTGEIISDETKTDMQEKHNNKVKIKTSVQGTSVTVSEKNKIANKLATCETIVSHSFVATKNINDVDKKMQEDSLSSITNCTSTVNRIEEDVPEVITDSTAEVVTGNEAEAITDNAAEAITGSIEMITGQVAEVIIDDVTEVIMDDAEEALTEDIVETRTRDIAEVIMEDTVESTTGSIVQTTMRDAAKVIIAKKVTQMATEDLPIDKQSEEEKKPLLRVRSFAKPPTTWEDGRHKTDKSPRENVPKETDQTKDIINLTDESNINKSVPTKYAVQWGNKIVPLMKAKHQTLVIPSGSNIINVQNITNNYLKVDTRTGQIISPIRNACVRPTIIQMPSAQTTTQQNQPQNANVVATARNEMSSKRNETVLRIIQPNKPIVTKKLVNRFTISQQANVHSSSKPK